MNIFDNRLMPAAVIFLACLFPSFSYGAVPGYAANGLIPKPIEYYAAEAEAGLEAGETWEVLIGDPLILAAGSKGGLSFMGLPDRWHSAPIFRHFRLGGGKRIAGGESCSFSVVFAPLATGDFEDSFNVPVLLPNSENWTVRLTGTGHSVMTKKYTTRRSTTPVFSTRWRVDSPKALCGLPQTLT